MYCVQLINHQNLTLISDAGLFSHKNCKCKKDKDEELGQIILENIWHPSVPYHIIIQINDAVFIKFLGLKVWCLFEGGVYLREVFIANFVRTTVNLWFIKNST